MLEIVEIYKIELKFVLNISSWRNNLLTKRHEDNGAFGIV